VLASTGERDMEKLGGLIHRMPQTAFMFLVGCAAISALPPLNGFVSEWLAFQAILVSPQLTSWGLKLMIPAAGALLALSAALAAACFVRVYGITFLGRPRSDAARNAHETERVSVVAMAILAAACLVLGILPGFAIDALAPVTHLVAGGRMPVQTSVEWLSIVPIVESRSSYNGLLVFLFMAASGMIGAYAIHRLASDKIRRSAIWDCGFPDASPVTQYSGDSFAQPIRRVFGTLVFRAREVGEMPPPNSPLPARFVAIVHDPIWETLYAPLASFVAVAAEKLNILQFLTIRRYLSLVFAALVLLLLVLAAWP
jgi:NADH:ubiquinone oxidoreductase subunit 5 (subunit L)/multisubunit Na+/H+ antiporter MnhA subunit